jgi:hypothetical protein
VDLCGLLHCVVSDRRSLWYASFAHNADIDPALRLLLPWSATYLRGFLIFATLFPVLVIRKADLHGTPSPITLTMRSRIQTVHLSFFLGWEGIFIYFHHSLYLGIYRLVSLCDLLILTECR